MSPIRPEMKSRYPKNWPEIREQILERAKNKCEECGVPNYAWIRWEKRGYHEQWKYVAPGDPGIQVVLTIAHIHDPSPENCDPKNLKALCQKHHNTLDAPMRAANRRKRLAEEAGQQDFLKAPPPKHAGPPRRRWRDWEKGD